MEENGPPNGCKLLEARSMSDAYERGSNSKFCEVKRHFLGSQKLQVKEVVEV